MNVIGRANLYELISVPYETYRNFLTFTKMGISGGESMAGILGIAGIGV
jgi:hypothetical protein